MPKFDKLSECGNSPQTRVSELNPILGSFLFSSHAIMQCEDTVASQVTWIPRCLYGIFTMLWASYQDAYHVKLPPFASRVNQLAGWHGLTLAESCSHSLALNIFWTVTVQFELPLSKIFLFTYYCLCIVYFSKSIFILLPTIYVEEMENTKNRAKGAISSWRWRSGVTLSNSRKKT